MDFFDDVLVAFWKALDDNKVKYLMVGGYAVILHGYERFTGDVDIWIEDTVDNRKALRKTCSFFTYQPTT